MPDQKSTPPAGALDAEKLKQEEAYNKNLYSQYAMQAAQNTAQLANSLFTPPPLYNMTTSGTTWTSGDITSAAYAVALPTITGSITMEAGWRYVTWEEDEHQQVTVQVVSIISRNVMSDGTMTYTLAGQHPTLSTKVRGMWLGVLEPGEPYEQDAEARERWAVKAEEASREKHAAQVARKLLKKAR